MIIDSSRLLQVDYYSHLDTHGYAAESGKGHVYKIWRGEDTGANEWINSKSANIGPAIISEIERQQTDFFSDHWFEQSREGMENDHVNQFKLWTVVYDKEAKGHQILDCQKGLYLYDTPAPVSPAAM